jgi:hypothetical protein
VREQLGVGGDVRRHTRYRPGAGDGVACRQEA